MTPDVHRACAELAFRYADVLRALGELEGTDKEGLRLAAVDAVRRLTRLEEQALAVRGTVRQATLDVVRLGHAVQP